MCVVSMIGDEFGQRWESWKPYIFPKSISSTSTDIPYKNPFGEIGRKGPTQKEFDDLKKEVEILKGLLARAKEYDKKNNEPHCEIENKMEFLKAVAKLVNVDLDEILSKK